MNDTLITLQGWLGGPVTLRAAGESSVASFRLACTPRRFNRRTNEWSNANTQWYTINAWRTLAEHCEQSLHRGDPVVVHGRLNASVWVNTDGIEVTSYEVDATFVGHDLSRGTSSFSRARPVVEETTEQAVGVTGGAGDPVPMDGPTDGPVDGPVSASASTPVVTADAA